jgi:hypothetical protein
VRKVGGNFENILSKKQNLSLGIYNPIDWHKREFVVRLKLASLPELPGPCSPVFCDW